VKFSPLLLKASRIHRTAVGKSWRMDETYIKLRRQWKSLSRAVDKAGNTVDCLLSPWART
jgi:putative transposase